MVRLLDEMRDSRLISLLTGELARLGQGIMAPAKRIGHAFGKAYLHKLTRDEYQFQKPPHRNERAIEYRFLFDCLVRTGARTVLDVGTGETALPHLLRTSGCHVTAIDSVNDFWPTGIVNRHWHVLKDDIRSPAVKGPFDLVVCISVIEHIRDHHAALSAIVKLVARDGHLVLTTPYTEQRSVPNVYAEPGAAYGQDLPYICRSSSRKELSEWLDATNTEIVVQEYWRCWTGLFWAQGERYLAPKQVTADEVHQLTCLLLRRKRSAINVES